MSLKERYLQACKQIDENAERAKRAQLNVIIQPSIQFNVGDIIEFNGTRIEVNRTLGGKTPGDPNIVYIGKELTKKNKPKKSGANGQVWADEDHKYIELIRKSPN